MTSLNFNTEIPTIGEAKIESPLKRHVKKGDPAKKFVSDDSRIIADVQMDNLKTSLKKNISFDQAGPRGKIYFDPSKLKCAIATCGGLCPGLNDIIRSIV